MANQANFDPNSIDKIVDEAFKRKGETQQPARPSAQPSQRLEEAISDYDTISQAAAEKLKAIGEDRNLTREGLENKFRELGIDWRDYSVCPVDYVKSGEQKGTHYIGPVDKKHVNPGAIPPRFLTGLADMQLCQEHSKPPVYEPKAVATTHQGQLEQKAGTSYTAATPAVPSAAKPSGIEELLPKGKIELQVEVTVSWKGKVYEVQDAARVNLILAATEQGYKVNPESRSKIIFTGRKYTAQDTNALTEMDRAVRTVLLIDRLFEYAKQNPSKTADVINELQKVIPKNQQTL